MRLALFGGTFDPPHCGHAAIARAAADRFLLDQVLFTPVAHQPLKAAASAAPFEHRLAMVRLACAADLRFNPSALDAPVPGNPPNYTVDTLDRLRLDHPHATLFTLVGMDSFLTLAQWRDPQRLLALCEWIVVSRPGFTSARAAPQPEGLSLTPRQAARIHLLDSVHLDISATALRARLAQGEDCEDALIAPVAEYIRHHHLYLPRA